MAETQEYRLTHGKHWEQDPERLGHIRRRVKGEIISLTEEQAVRIADKIEPAGGKAKGAGAKGEGGSAKEKRRGRKRG